MGGGPYTVVVGRVLNFKDLRKRKRVYSVGLGVFRIVGKEILYEP